MNRDRPTTRPPRARRWGLLLLLSLLAIGPDSTIGESSFQAEGVPWIPPASLFDPRLEPLRLASANWEVRQGPARSVVDQVCLVPDLPTFLEAISTWDRSHYFPILFDDVDSTARFLRAFRPARIIRMPRTARPTGDPGLWDRAVAAVGASWMEGARAVALPGNVVPRAVGQTPPGVVISSPKASMLAGAVALAAGRFQPLVKLDCPRRYADILDLDEFREFRQQVETTVKAVAPNFAQLGDDCDFVTVAGDWPYRYRDAKGEVEATDDGLCRIKENEKRLGVRWAADG